MTEGAIERAARAMNLEAGRQRGLAFEDDWDEITEQERGGWRLCAQAALRASSGASPAGLTAEGLIDALDDDGETFVVFTDAWRELSAESQLAQADYWLRAALRGRGSEGE